MSRSPRVAPSLVSQPGARVRWLTHGGHSRSAQPGRRGRGGATRVWGFHNPSGPRAMALEPQISTTASISTSALYPKSLHLIYYALVVACLSPLTSLVSIAAQAIFDRYREQLLLAQILSLRAFAGKTLTTFDAGFAATFTSLPNITLVPAFRAGLCWSSSVKSFGMTNFWVFLTSA